jgi:hypothetical protein
MDRSPLSRRQQGRWILIGGDATTLVATPIAAVLRSGWLGTPPVPIFVAVMAGVSLVGLGLWRTAYALLRRDRLV